MKKLLLFATMVCMTLSSCTHDMEVGISINKTSISFTDTASKDIITFNSPLDWTAEVVDANKNNWVSITPTSGDIGNASITIQVTNNDTAAPRQASICLKIGTLQKNIDITQEQNDVIISDENYYTINYIGGKISATIKHNIDFDIQIEDDWITLDATRGLSTNTLTFNIAENPYTDFREGKIILTSEDNQQSQIITIHQNAYLDEPIVFEQDIVKQACCFHFDLNKDGELSYREAAQVTEIPSNFFEGVNGRYEVMSFNELQYFTSTKILGDRAFLGCSDLTSITIPDSVSTIGNYAFSLSRLTNITIPNSVIEIGEGSFYGCEFLTSVTIGDSVTSIGDKAFSSCGSLTSITIPNSVIEIGEGSFYGCEFLTSVTIGDSVTSIGDKAFSFCESLTSITIPNSVIEIGEETFDHCINLTSVTIGDSVTSIGKCAFQYCVSLSNVTIGNGVTSIGNFAFYWCKGLKNIKIGNNVTEIGGCAFELCTSLKDIEIGNNVIKIGGGAFGKCTSLKNITIPDKVTTIGKMAFQDCENLTSVTIGNGVTSIENGAFKDCHALTTFYGKYASDDNRCLIIDGNLHSFAPAGLTAYTIPDNITSIEDSCFANCKALESIKIPDSVTKIGNECFADCEALKSIKIPDGVTIINNRMFIGCKTLTNVNIPNNVTSIMYYAFNDCYSLTSITIPDNVTLIGSHAFCECGLLNVTIGNSVNSIMDFAFGYCPITTVTIPDSVTSIDENAFYGCNSLLKVYCKSTTPPYLGSDAFGWNASGRKIYVPKKSVKTYKSAPGWSEYANDIVGYDF